MVIRLDIDFCLSGQILSQDKYCCDVIMPHCLEEAKFWSCGYLDIFCLMEAG